MRKVGDVVIRAENLGKKYLIGHEAKRERYTALRDVIARNIRGLGRSAAEMVRGRTMVAGDEIEEFWALKDINFEIKRGEVIGIIGRNGAGKSTLLKILSRITEPSEGRVKIRGRVASLLEVGTGFHPELTGRENIFLNGAILGMARAEIKRKFDEIVTFAEVERFLDTPVKRYSSGMYVRLAFSVAAHMEPEILIVDEVLAVGDAAFQEKCIGKMNGVAATEGRTVLFVSHNKVAIKQLCQRGILLENGQVLRDGATGDVLTAYMAGTNPQQLDRKFQLGDAKGDGRLKLISYNVTNAAGKTAPMPGTREDLLINLEMDVIDQIIQPALGISIENQHGVLMTELNTAEQGIVLPPLLVGRSTAEVRINAIPFLPGTYFASFWVMNPQGHIYARIDNLIRFEVAQVPLYGSSLVDHRWGCVFSDIEFSVKPSRELVQYG